jgi:hypothetical protein
MNYLKTKSKEQSLLQPGDMLYFSITGIELVLSVQISDDRNTILIKILPLGKETINKRYFDLKSSYCFNILSF